MREFGEQEKGEKWEKMEKDRRKRKREKRMDKKRRVGKMREFRGSVGSSRLFLSSAFLLFYPFWLTFRVPVLIPLLNN